MTSYAGKPVGVEVEATDEDANEVFTDSSGTMTVTVWDLDRVTVLVHEAQMTYVPDRDVWFFAWAPPFVPGAYRARVTARAGTLASWEFVTIRLRQNKAPVPIGEL